MPIGKKQSFVKCQCGIGYAARRNTVEHMKKRRIIICAVCIMCAAALCAAVIVSCTPTFQGSRVKNPDAYLLDIQKMNGTDVHTLQLSEGDVLQVRFETVKGSLRMEIKAPDGTAVYSGNGRETTGFSLSVPQGGAYTVTVEARQAAGTIHISLTEP